MQVQKTFNIILSVLVIVLFFLLLTVSRNNRTEDLDVYDRNTSIKLEQPEFFLKEEPTSNAVLEALYYYQVEYPEIVFAQAILETGYFRSKICKEYNNLFGLYNTKKQDYCKFNHWTESIVGYLKYIQYKYKAPEDYYDFLERIGYAEDPMYIYKLQELVNY